MNRSSSGTDGSHHKGRSDTKALIPRPWLLGPVPGGPWVRVVALVRSVGEQAVGEGLRVERQQILQGFTHSHIADGDP